MPDLFLLNQSSERSSQGNETLMTVPLTVKTRSSAQGNCSAKSLAASVMSSILPCSSILPYPPYLPPVMLSTRRVLPLAGGSASGRRVLQGEGVPWGEGAGGHFSPAAITALPHGASP